MAVRPEVKALIDYLVEQWVTEVLDEARDVQHRVITAAVSPPHASPPRHDAEAVPAMLTTHEAAAYLRLSESTLTKLRVAGGGPPFLKLGRRVTYRTAVLDAWLAEREYPHTSAVDAGVQLAKQPETTSTRTVRGRRRRSRK